jgi:hypothetical protein
MTACPIRYQRQVPDRKGKIFYTSITSLSHISKESGHEAAHGWRRCRSGGHHPDSPAERSVRLRTVGGDCRPVHIIIRKAIVTISHTEGESDERDFIVSWQ